MKIFTFSIRKIILPTIFCLFTICLVLFSKQNLTATKTGLSLWFNSVVPSLLPFFIATELLGYTNIVSKIGKLLNKIMKPLFNVPGIGAYAFVMGVISGYPVGAKIVTSFREQGICTKAQCERLLAFTNNSGPLFIIGTVGISLFANTAIGSLLLFTHILAGICVGIIFRFWKYNDTEEVSQNATKCRKKNRPQCDIKNLGTMLSSSISNAISSVVMIGGFVVLFSIVISMLNSSGVFIMLSSIFTPLFNFLGIDGRFFIPFVSGIVELTNGISGITNIMTKNISVNIVLVAFLLGFGGFSVLLQVFSIISKTDISILPYLLGKLLHGAISALFTYLFIHSFPMFNLDLAPTFATGTIDNVSVLSSFSNYGVIACGIFVLIAVFCGYKVKCKEVRHY